MYQNQRQLHDDSFERITLYTWIFSVSIDEYMYMDKKFGT